MAPSFDYAVSSLLCVEEDDGLFNENDQYAKEEEFEVRWFQTKHRLDCFNGDCEIPIQSSETLMCLIEKECQFLPKVDYLKRLRNGDLDLVSRNQAVDWISKVHTYFGYGPLSLYLSINYLDRFIAAYDLPKGKDWTTQLLAVACLSLAAKVEETELPSSLDLQVGESRFVFEPRTIQRMELLVLSSLSWRMHAITPFSFIDFFVNKINNDESPPRSLMLQSIQLIISTIKGIDFLEFRPSEVAAAVAIAAAEETNSVVVTEQAVSALAKFTSKERVMECVKMIHDLSLMDGPSGVGATLQPVPESPIWVLEAACLSYKSDDITVGSCTSTPLDNTPHNKRRKLDTPM